MTSEYVYEVVKDYLAPDCIRSAAEEFANSTAGGIVPITKIDDQIIGSGSTGTITHKLQDGYWMLHNDPHYISMIDYLENGK